ncbi:MAG: cation:proton antiporter [Nitrososphaerota archaeon]|nr:cation:proton antiporter [Nitrososphaerota archaeon]MDG7039999.1 cation:proton antiporter [Nitrososphaerota archaeon]MDG7041951.1 cation:proton antiporter [Nitrososphaerota archaeon]MDG7045395.1 cation:proton antiporter [Nitrososphaerota archaeon]MDG7046846.1 cation:proton antiporter [Nitrososphaerota archaeon]
MAILSGIPIAISSLAFLGILLITAKAGEEVFHRLGLTPFVGAILVGVLLGPGVFGIISVLPTISLFISLGIDFLLFVSGAEEFDSAKLRKVFRKRGSLEVSLLQFVVRLIAITVISYLIFHSVVEAIIIGIVVGMSSAGPLSRLLSDTGLARTDEGTAIFSQVLVIEVAAVILYSFVYDLVGKYVTITNLAIISGELVAAVLAIIVFGRFIMIPLLERVEVSFKSREAVFAIIISILLIAGFAGQITGFNAAIVALFLGLLMQKFLAARPVLMEKLRAFTYGFFEPMFFAGIGLYFIRITPSLIVTGLAIFGIALALNTTVGAGFARFFNVGIWRNAFGTGVKGGVDAALLVSSVTASVLLIRSYAYSATAIGIALLAIATPLLFRMRAPLISVNHETGTKRKVVKQQLQEMTAEEISKILPTVVLSADEPAIQAFRKLSEHDARAAVVLNSENIPVATLLMRDVLTLSRREMTKVKVSDVQLAEVVKVGRNEPGLRLTGIFRETNIPIIAVVDEKGGLIGTIQEREVLRRLVESLDKDT